MIISVQCYYSYQLSERFNLKCLVVNSPHSLFPVLCSGNEICERLAFYGVNTNLVSYLTQKLHEGNVSAARMVSTWSGTCYITPLIGAFLADAYWGKYWSIAVFSVIHFIVISQLFFYFPCVLEQYCKQAQNSLSQLLFS